MNENVKYSNNGQWSLEKSASKPVAKKRDMVGKHGKEALKGYTVYSHDTDKTTGPDGDEDRFDVHRHNIHHEGKHIGHVDTKVEAGHHQYEDHSLPEKHEHIADHFDGIHD